MFLQIFWWGVAKKCLWNTGLDLPEATQVYSDSCIGIVCLYFLSSLFSLCKSDLFQIFLFNTLETNFFNIILFGTDLIFWSEAPNKFWILQKIPKKGLILNKCPAMEINLCRNSHECVRKEDEHHILIAEKKMRLELKKQEFGSSRSKRISSRSLGHQLLQDYCFM